MLFAEAKLRKGDPEGAVILLEPFSPSDKDTAFLALFGEGLLRTGRLDRAREVFEAYYRQKPDGFGKLFDVAGAYVRVGEDQKASALLEQIKEVMRKARKEGDLATQIDRLVGAYPTSLPLAQSVARIYEDLNREAKYFEALMRLFDLLFTAERFKEACDVLDKLVDIDPYDYRNQERISKLEGKVDPAFIQNILARAAKAATVSTRTDGFSGAGAGAAAPPAVEGTRAQQALEDLIVQVEIFLQYSLQAKAIERLERLAQAYPGEEDRNERLARALRTRQLVAPGRGLQARVRVCASANGGPFCICRAGRSGIHGACATFCFLRGNASRPCGHRRNQPADAPPGHLSRSARHHGGASRQAPECDAMSGRRGRQLRGQPFHCRIFCAGRNACRSRAYRRSLRGSVPNLTGCRRCNRLGAFHAA